MKRKLLIVCTLASMITTANAQWRAGITIGGDWNNYTIDKHYMTDWHYKGQWGWTLGLTGQYNFNEWFGVRADLNWTQKNHQQYRTGMLENTNYDTWNGYLQMPVMASFSFGGQKVRGFLNLGVYGGYWLNSRREGSDYNNFGEYTINFSEKVELNSDRDQRLDFGFLGGLGLEYRITPHWAAQAEVRYYYGTVSTQKQYMRVKDYRYNSTTAVQLAAYYVF